MMKLINSSIRFFQELVLLTIILCQRSWNGTHRTLVRSLVLATVIMAMVYASSYYVVKPITTQIAVLRSDLDCVESSMNNEFSNVYVQLTALKMDNQTQQQILRQQYAAIIGLQKTANSWQLQRKLEAQRRLLESKLEVTSPLATIKVKEVKTSRQQFQANYAEHYSKIAQIEMAKYGIPASITLAQAILEGGAGESMLAVQANNHFGIKCFKKECKKNRGKHTAHCMEFADDHKHDRFKVYASAWESFRAHSIFLQRDNYKACRRLKPTDYKGWARELKKAGYATSATYDKKLIRLIEDLDLHKYDI